MQTGIDSPIALIRESKFKLVIFWLLTGFFFIYAMMTIGAITRLTHSGLSMVHWSITGSLPPLNDHEWQLEFAKYQQSPEYKIVNYHYSLEDFKSIYWWEYLHRFFGRTIGVLFIVPFLFFYIRKMFPPRYIWKMLLLLTVGAIQGFLGWFMVKSGLQNDPYVSHYRLAIHLTAAFASAGLTLWFMLDLIYPDRSTAKNNKLRRLAVLFLSVVMIQVVYGAFVAGLKAGIYFPTFPKMGEDWIPDAIFKQVSPVWRNFIDGQYGVQFIHRYIAYLVIIVAFILWRKIRNSDLPVLQKKIAGWMMVIVLIQVTLGISTLLFHVPVSIATIHQSGAILLYASTLFLIHRL